ncbi:MAG: acyltransferase family protein [Coriobacteriia bacterium]|nr:acyltransferase family protein [Coriobacteriia bacterium]
MPRDNSVDALRGLAIALVVLGHAILDSAAVLHGGPGMIDMGPFWIPLATAWSLPLNVLYSFHMPLFAFVSGLVMWPPRGRSLAEGIASRARSLLVPYFAWFVILYATNWSPHPSGGFGPALLDALLGRDGLWFLYALFVSTAVVLCLERVARPRWVLSLAALVAIACSSGFAFAVPNVLYLSDVLWIFPFVVLGYLMGPFKSHVIEHGRLVAASGFVVFMPLFAMRYPVEVASLQPINRLTALLGRSAPGGTTPGLTVSSLSVLLPYACGCAAVVALYGLYLGRTGTAIDIQAWLGRKSLGIYAMHGPVVWWLASHGVRDVAVLTSVSLGLCVLATALLERIPLLQAVLLGQRRRRSSEVSG